MLRSMVELPCLGFCRTLHSMALSFICTCNICRITYNLRYNPSPVTFQMTFPITRPVTLPLTGSDLIEDTAVDRRWDNLAQAGCSQPRCTWSRHIQHWYNLYVNFSVSHRSVNRCRYGVRSKDRVYGYRIKKYNLQVNLKLHKTHEHGKEAPVCKSTIGHVMAIPRFGKDVILYKGQPEYSAVGGLWWTMCIRGGNSEGLHHEDDLWRKLHRHIVDILTAAGHTLYLNRCTLAGCLVGGDGAGSGLLVRGLLVQGCWSGAHFRVTKSGYHDIGLFATKVLHLPIWE